MKSPLVMNASYISEENKGRYSDIQVLKSNAGFYLGTVFVDEDGFKEPGSRDSDYYTTKEEAEAALRVYQSLDGETAALVLRSTP